MTEQHLVLSIFTVIGSQHTNTIYRDYFSALVQCLKKCMLRIGSQPRQQYR